MLAWKEKRKRRKKRVLHPAFVLIITSCPVLFSLLWSVPIMHSESPSLFLVCLLVRCLLCQYLSCILSFLYASRDWPSDFLLAQCLTYVSRSEYFLMPVLQHLQVRSLAVFLHLCLYFSLLVGHFKDFPYCWREYFWGMAVLRSKSYEASFWLWITANILLWHIWDTIT